MSNGLHNGLVNGLNNGLYNGLLSDLFNSNSDKEANAFITNHQLNTGLVMGIIQKQAIINRYRRYKGIIKNPNGSLLWIKLLNSNSRMWIHCPTSDTMANDKAYQMEFVTQKPLGIFGGFVNTDFTVNGVTGGAGKFFNSQTPMANFQQNSMAVGFYNRDSTISNQFECGIEQNTGTVNSTTIAIRYSGGSQACFWRLIENGSTTGSSYLPTATESLGVVLVQRSNGTTEEIYTRGVFRATKSSISSTPTLYPIYFHCVNEDNTSYVQNGTRQLASYYVGLPSLTANEISDMNWIENLYHTEIITGGRNV